MNRQVTTREEILSQCRLLVIKGGIPAVSIRSVAAACGVALGSLYNYFPSKGDLVMATVESVWEDIFSGPEAIPRFSGFLQAVSWVEDSLRRGSASYPGFFTLHAMGFAQGDRGEARHRMRRHILRVKDSLRQALMADPAVDKTAFVRGLRPEGLVDLVFQGVLAACLQQGDSGSLLALLRLALYQGD